jgi:mono/diheme cytochrome c family protein
MLRLVALAALLTASIAVQNPGKDGTRKDAAKDAAAKTPLPYTTGSIARGKQFYLVHCVECHDQDGKGLGRRDFNGTPPADLTNPDEWLYGTSAEAIFSSIREGSKNDMPSFKDKLQDEQIWQVVNFLRSLWPESRRPKLETDAGPKQELRGIP